ncbi:iron complex transport system permease protein [Knoellia remsis]|uniref:Iron complex transport system permease protein n=1 Tax=Knoellia remsis TaxID=407159 RepID=A0A2T0UU76_9MICO|nr:iron ABC transporter permease [Knoellia remsis]PRY61454.1 iron complex transport system permease protein [Knoellia remsis]
MQGKPHLTRPLLLGSGLLVLAVLASLAFGAEALSAQQVWHALVAPSGTDADVIVRDLRLPRTELGLLVGASLGVAGALMQTLTRNPLAEPGLFGVSAGAALAVVVGIRLGLAGTVASSVWWALLGAVLATALIFVAASRLGRAGLAPVTLAVLGVAVSAGLAAITSAFVLLDTRTLDGYRFWAVGSLSGRGDGVAGQVLPFLAVGAVLTVLAARDLDHFVLGDDLARGLGVSLTRLRLLGVVAIGVLTAAGVAACGPIAFVGLLTAHAGRVLVGSRHLLLLPLCALLGASALLLADVAGRLVTGNGELQAGVVLGLVGGPLFVALIARRRIAL